MHQIVAEAVGRGIGPAVLRTAVSLVSENGENPEYDRALAEMTCDLVELSQEFKGEVLEVIREQAQAANPDVPARTIHDAADDLVRATHG